MRGLFIAFAVLIPVFGRAQLGVLDRFKQKVKNYVEQRVDEGMDKVVNKIEEKVNKKLKTSGCNCQAVKVLSYNRLPKNGCSKGKGLACICFFFKQLNKYSSAFLFIQIHEAVKY